MIVHEAPSEWHPEVGQRGVFLAGGISGVHDWQTVALRRLGEIYQAGAELVCLNPRRREWPMGDPTQGRVQIAWEHRHLALADVVLFWFPAGSVQPIALYELGAWAKARKSIIVGCDPEYERRFDVVEQLRLERSGVPVLASLEDVCRRAAEALERVPTPA